MKSSKIDILKAAKHLSSAWGRYTDLFGHPPHGTEKQMAALLELAKTEEWTTDGAVKRRGARL